MARTRWAYDDRYLTDEESAAIGEILQRARDRLLAQGERNGTCPCRCQVPLNDDGTNPCGCCNEPVLDLPDDVY